MKTWGVRSVMVESGEEVEHADWRAEDPLAARVRLALSEAELTA